MKTLFRHVISRGLITIITLTLMTANAVSSQESTEGGFFITPVHATDSECNGRLMIEASGTSGPFTLSINQPDGSNLNFEEGVMWELSALCPGIYVLEFTNPYGCSYFRNVELQACNLIFNEDRFLRSIHEPEDCNSTTGNIYFRFGPVVTGGVNPAVQQLFTEDGQEIVQDDFGGWSNLLAGDYTYLFTDAVGCTFNYNFSIGAENSVEFSFFPELPCPNMENGNIWLSIDADPGFTVLWDDGSEEEVLRNVGEGMYCVTVTSVSGCEVDDCFDLSSLPSGQIPLQAEASPYYCEGREGDIEITSNWSGGVNANLTFTWDDGFVGRDRQGLRPGNYCVTATDGCSNTGELCVEIETGEVIPIEVDGSVTHQCLNEITGAVSQHGNINITPRGGSTNGFTYKWSTGSTDQDISFLEPGEYCVTVTDGLDCSNEVRRCFTVLRTDIDISLVDIEHCSNGDCSGSALEVTATSNTNESLTYEWFAYLDGGGYFSEFGARIEGLPSADEYCVKVRTGVNCGTTVCYEILDDCSQVTPLPEFTLDELVVWPVSSFFTSGAAAISNEINLEGISVNWQGPNGFTGNGAVLEPAAGVGNYYVTISNGCEEKSVEFKIEECAENFNLPISDIDDRCANDGYAFYTIRLEGLVPGQSYYFFNGNGWSFLLEWPENQTGTTAQFSEVPFTEGPGTYTIYIRDENNCVSTATMRIRPGNENIENFEFLWMGTTNQGLSWTPSFCAEAAVCGDDVVDAYPSNNNLLMNAFPTPQGGCAVRIECGEEGSVAVDLPGIIETGTFPDIQTGQCVTGSFCRVQTAITNLAFSRVNEFPDNTLYTIEVDVPISIQSSEDIEPEYLEVNGRCVERWSCGRSRWDRDLGPGSINRNYCLIIGRYAHCATEINCAFSPYRVIRQEDRDSRDCCPQVRPPVTSQGLFDKFVSPLSLEVVVDLINGRSSENSTSLISSSAQIKFDLSSESGHVLAMESKEDALIAPMIFVSPNPVEFELQVKLLGQFLSDDSGTEEQMVVNVFSASGSLMIEKVVSVVDLDHLDTFGVDVSSLPRGIYFIRVSGPSFAATKKFVKE